MFYLTGSRATKFGKKKKAELEDGYHEAGYRSGWQVLSNSFSALLACVLWNTLFSPTSLQATLLSLLGPDFVGSLVATLGLTTGTIPEYHNDWCPIDKEIAGGWSRACVFAALG